MIRLEKPINLGLGLILLGLGASACQEPGGGDDEVGTETEGGSDTATDTGETGTSTDTGETTTTTTADTGETTTATGETTDTGTGGEICGDDEVANLSFEAAYDDIEHGWARVERWRIDSPAIPDDPFFPDSRSEQVGQQLEFFDFDPTPSPQVFLLEYAPGWDQAQGNPVLLVHGADDPPDRAWANPNLLGPYGCGAMECPTEGLMQGLAAADVPVFAIAFPNTQGDNFMWVEQIHAAIQVVLERTCAEQVDLIGWSKGSFAARLYAGSLREDWNTPYADQVRKLILIGGPNLGFDYMFRYGSGNNSTVWPPGMAHGPTPHHEQLVGLQVVDRSEYAVYETAGGYYFRGQAQMIASWIDEYSLTATANNGLGPYAVVDSLSTYFGEDEYAGLYARGKGVQFTVDQGSIVEDMVTAGIPASVETYLLCGEMVGLDDYLVGIPNEISGPSDGVVLVDSCASAEGVGQLGEAAILEGLNHLELGWIDEAEQTIIGWLGE